jgi:5-methylcytosine-specific restriction protein A
MRPKHPCNHPGCGTLVDAKATYCQGHQRQRWREQSAQRARRGGRRWRKLRALKLRTNPICEICNDAVTAEVDHKVPVAQAPEQEFIWDNLQSACIDCHRAKTAAEMRTG